MSTKQDGQHQYDDMIHLPHHVSSRHPQMSMTDRAAQFSPFAALTGYGDAVREKARLTEQKPDLSEEERAELDYKLQMACGPDSEGERPEVRITYFVPDRDRDQLCNRDPDLIFAGAGHTCNKKYIEGTENMKQKKQYTISTESKYI